MSDPYDPRSAFPAPLEWSTERVLPDGFLPMLATSAAGPMDSREHGYEVKWEGLRVLVGLEGRNWFLRGGTGQDARPWFAETERVRAATQPDWVLLDGELVVLEDERPSLMRLQQRLLARDESQIESLAAEFPTTLMLYDVLRIGDSWLLDVNWEERRDILMRVVTAAPGVEVSPVSRDGAQAMEWARQRGLESVVAKRLKGRYSPGERTRDWLNIKPREIVEAVICGWTEGRGARGGTIGTLLLGDYRDGQLVYIGHTGTGLDAETLRTLHHDLVERSQPWSPFKAAPHVAGEPRWVRPGLMCRIRHQGWKENGTMSSPTFLGVVEQAPPPVAAPRASSRRR